VVEKKAGDPNPTNFDKPVHLNYWGLISRKYSMMHYSISWRGVLGVEKKSRTAALACRRKA